MNVPKPCDTCDNLYVDCMSKDQPDGYVECMSKTGKEKWGNSNCPCWTENGWCSKAKCNFLIKSVGKK